MLGADDHDDPVAQRLFPKASDDDAEAEAYRDLVGDELRTGKIAALDTIARALGEAGEEEVDVVLDEGAVEAWLTTLTDLRLAIGTRLEVTEETMDEEVEPDDPRAPSLAVLHWLGYMQETLLEALGPPTREE